ncbi:MAG: ribosome-binding factor A [Planctomycetes bacterium]|nr:ribosome-binding factor A [Planctomycetota bacterium]
MSAKKPSRKEMLPLVAELRPDDGIDPRELARQEKPRKGQRKARQLCAQVAETLSLVLSGECADELLQSVQILAVDPAPDATQLVVTVQAGLPGEQADPAEVLERLNRDLGRLRSHVAAAITRKRAPKLVFRVV